MLKRNRNASSLPISEGEIILTKSLGRHSVRNLLQKKRTWHVRLAEGLTVVLRNKPDRSPCCCCCCCSCFGKEAPQVFVFIFLKKNSNKPGTLALCGGNTYLHGSTGCRAIAKYSDRVPNDPFQTGLLWEVKREVSKYLRKGGSRKTDPRF